MIERVLDKVGNDTSLFSGISARRGGLSTAFEEGAPARPLHAERIPKTQLLDAMLSSAARCSSARPRRALAFDSTPPNLRLQHSPMPRMAGLYGLASAQPVRPPAGRLTARRPGLRKGDVTAVEVTSPPGDPHCARYRLCRCAASVRMHAATWRCGYPADSSDGSGWRCYLYPFTPLAPVGSRPAAHTRPGHGRRPGQPIRVGPEPLTQTVRPTGAPARASPSATGPRGQAAHSVGSGQL